MSLAFIHDPYIVQPIGVLALIVTARTFQANKRRNMLHLQFLASILYAIHFILLGAHTGAALHVTGATRDYVYDHSLGRWRHHWPPFVFAAIIVVASILTWEGPHSILPLLGSLSITVAFWQRSPRMIRLFALLSPPLWFAYDFISHSYPGMIAETLLFASTFIGMYRFDRLSHKSSKSLQKLKKKKRVH